MIKPISSPISHPAFRIILIFLLTLCIGVQHSTAKTKTPDLVVFGDSTSDTGNAYQIIGTFAQAPYELIPSAPYAISDGRFSNGKIWIDRLAKTLKKKKGAKASLTNPKRHTNYATATARARTPDSPSAQVSLNMQVVTFLNTFGNEAPADALYVFWIGGNDIRDALNALLVDPTGTYSVGILTEAVASIATNITTLRSNGARHFLVMNSPDIGLLPAVRLQGDLVAVAGNSLTTMFNQLLATTISAAMDRNNIAFFDTFAAFNHVVTNPQDYDLINVTDTCLNVGDELNPVCDDPKGYMFWDGIHPTAKTHKILSEAVELFISMHEF